MTSPHLSTWVRRDRRIKLRGSIDGVPHFFSLGNLPTLAPKCLSVHERDLFVLVLVRSSFVRKMHEAS